MLDSSLNLVSTVIGFGLSAVFILFVFFRIFFGGDRSDDDSRATAAGDHEEVEPDVEQPGNLITGLDPILIAAIPTVKYMQDSFTSSKDTQCSICLGEYEEKEILRVMPACNHSFHLACIDVWLLKQSTCPICRVPLMEILEAKVFGTQTVGSPDVLR